MSGQAGAPGDAEARRLHVVLVEPEIPQNTGNVARTCAAVGAALHLVHPLGFEISDRTVRRAGLDYWHLVELYEHASLSLFLDAHEEGDLYFFSTRGGRILTSVSYGFEQSASDETVANDCYLLFGKETQGLPDWLLATHPDRVLRIPVRAEARSLNLSNAVAVAVYEVLRQWEYRGLAMGK